MDTDAVLAATFTAILPHLNERQRRLLLGAAARALGRGGPARVTKASGASRPTVDAGIRELAQPGGPEHSGRVRRPGADAAAWSSATRGCLGRWTGW